MALESILGLPSFNLNELEKDEIERKSAGNFRNPMNLALPPFENVSNHFPLHIFFIYYTKRRQYYQVSLQIGYLLSHVFLVV